MLPRQLEAVIRLGGSTEVVVLRVNVEHTAVWCRPMPGNRWEGVQVSQQLLFCISPSANLANLKVQPRTPNKTRSEVLDPTSSSTLILKHQHLIGSDNAVVEMTGMRTYTHNKKHSMPSACPSPPELRAGARLEGAPVPVAS